MKEQIVFYGQARFDQPRDISLSRDALKELKEILEKDKRFDNG